MVINAKYDIGDKVFAIFQKNNIDMGGYCKECGEFKGLVINKKYWYCKERLFIITDVQYDFKTDTKFTYALGFNMEDGKGFVNNFYTDIEECNIFESYEEALAECERRNKI